MRGSDEAGDTGLDLVRLCIERDYWRNIARSSFRTTARAEKAADAWRSAAVWYFVAFVAMTVAFVFAVIA